MKKLLMAAGAAALLAGCTSILIGTDQTVSVTTPNLTGAACKLRDSKKGRWYLPSTPGRVTVPRGRGPLSVTCEKAGYQTTTVSVEGRVAPNEIAGALPLAVVAGAAGFGTSLIVDGASGAIAQYPDEIIVPMRSSAVASAGGGADGPASNSRRGTQSLIEGLPRLSPMPVAVAVAPIRAEPNPTAKVVKLVRWRDEVHIIDTVPSGWVQVAESGIAIGWIHWTAFPIPRQSIRRGIVPASD